MLYMDNPAANSKSDFRMHLKDLLPNPDSWEYQPEYGSPITLDSFHPVAPDPQFHAVFACDFAFRDRDVHARLEVFPQLDAEAGYQAQLLIDGNYQVWQDPHSYLIGTAVTDLENWVAWVFSVDGESRRQRRLTAHEQAQVWGSDSVEGMLSRVDLGISAYDRRSTNSANFVSARELQAWLDSVNPNQYARFTVYPLFDLEAFQAVAQPQRHFIIHRGSVELSEPKILYSVSFAQPTLENNFGMGPVSAGWVMSSNLTLAYDGASYAAHDSLDVLDLAGFPGVLGSDLDSSAPWYVLAVDSLELGILCPAAGACIELDWDHDGATVSLTVTDEDRVVVDNMANTRHRKQWSKFYAADVELTESELATALDFAQGALLDLMRVEDAILAAEAEDE